MTRDQEEAVRQLAERVVMALRRIDELADRVSAMEEWVSQKRAAESAMAESLNPEPPGDPDADPRA